MFNWAMLSLIIALKIPDWNCPGVLSVSPHKSVIVRAGTLPCPLLHPQGSAQCLAHMIALS